MKEEHTHIEHQKCIHIKGIMLDNIRHGYSNQTDNNPHQQKGQDQIQCTGYCNIPSGYWSG